MKNGLVPGIVFVISLLCAYAWWEYHRKTDSTPWELVPRQALLAYQHHKDGPADPAPALLKSFVNDSLAQKILQHPDLVVSVHIVSIHEMGYVLYLSAANEIESTLMKAFTQNHSLHERTLNGFTLREGAFIGRKTLTFTTYKGVLIMGSTSWLIEEVIRRAVDEDQLNFAQHHRAILQMNKTTGDSLAYYADLSQFSKWLNVFYVNKNDNPALVYFGKSLGLTIRQEKESMLLSGFANDTLTERPAFLSTFNHQHPVPLTLQRVVSNRTGLLIDFGMSDFPQWNVDRLAFSAVHHLALADSLTALTKRHHFDVASFYTNLGNEAGIVQSGVFRGDLTILEVKDPGRMEGMLEKLDRQRGLDQLPTETFSHYQIHFLERSTLPQTLLWPLVSRKMKYYTLTEHHLLFAEQLDDLKAFLSDLDAESTWGKSTAWNEFLSTSQDTNVGVIIDINNWWPALSNELTPWWQHTIDSIHVGNLDKVSMQVSRLEKSYYFNGILKFGKKGVIRKPEGMQKSEEVVLKRKIAAGPFLVKNHNNGIGELLLQDDGNNLQLFSSSLKNMFSTDVLASARTDFYQIDFLKNKKLQYLFAIDKKLQLIDRLGNPVKGFPVALKEVVRFLTVLDYDNNRNYRYLMTDDKGELTMLDRLGQGLSDWKDFKPAGTIWVAPRGVRTQGKDFIVVVTVDGLVYLLNRKGEVQDGFPVSLKLRPAGNWFFDESGDQGLITLVNSEGLLVQLDVKGKIVHQSNMPRSSAACTFSLTVSSDGDQYVISRIDRSHVAALNGHGDVVWEKENPGSDQMILSYEALGHGKAYFSLTDVQQEFVHVMDEKGISVFSNPLESQRPPVILVDRNEIGFYCMSGNILRIYRPVKGR